MGLYDMANASNEMREQNIMRLRNLFDHGYIMTVLAAHQRLGYTEATIKKWCRDGDIPLIDHQDEHGTVYVVPLTDQNWPKWLDRAR